jgi:CRISPR-associated Cas5-like protein
MQTVIFTLFAPIAAMGDVAVGERRAGFDRPGRSAVLGLVAAALGLDRGDEAAHSALDAAYLLSLRLIAQARPCSGSPLSFSGEEGRKNTPHINSIHPLEGLEQPLSRYASTSLARTAVRLKSAAPNSAVVPRLNRAAARWTEIDAQLTMRGPALLRGE